MTVNTVIAGLEKSVKAIENKLMIKLPKELTDFSDLPELKYKKSGGLTKAAQKRLEIWRDVKKAKLYLKKRALEKEYERLEKEKIKSEIWDTLKTLSERYQHEMGYVNVFNRLIEEAPKKFPKSSLEKLDELRIHLNALLYEAQTWQSHDSKYRGVVIDIEITDLISKIARLLHIKDVEIDEAVVSHEHGMKTEPARLFIGGKEVEI